MKKLRANIKVYILFFITIVISLLLLLSFSSSSANEIKIGVKAPEFQLFNQNNELVSLSDYKGKNLVIYFFPKAFTPGWVKQACGFRDEYSEYSKHDIEIIGISYDTKKRQKEFANRYNLLFPLLSDLDASISKSYGVDTYFFPKRVTFLINKDGVVFDIIKNISLDNYGNKIIQIFKKNNLINNEK